jgi:hypothetical protein
MKVPSVRRAEAFLAEAARLNPGPWVEHSRVASVAARATQLAQSDLGARVAAGGVLERLPSTQERGTPAIGPRFRRRGPLAGRRGAPGPGEAPSRWVAGENVTDAGRWCRSAPRPPRCARGNERVRVPPTSNAPTTPGPDGRRRRPGRSSAPEARRRPPSSRGTGEGRAVLVVAAPVGPGDRWAATGGASGASGRHAPPPSTGR